MTDEVKDEALKIITMSKVLIAVDASEHADYAFEYYMKCFHKDGNKVLLLTCPEIYLHEFGTMSRGRIEELQREVREETEKLEKKWKEMAENAGIDYQWLVQYAQKPGHAIVEVAEAQGVESIITGTRGMGKLRRTILGSVSDYVVHHAHVPVLVCRHKNN